MIRFFRSERSLPLNDTELNLIRPIIASQGDLTPVLVYADWLEEQKLSLQHSLAEYLRNRCHLVAMQPKVARVVVPGSFVEITNEISFSDHDGMDLIHSVSRGIKLRLPKGLGATDYPKETWESHLLMHLTAMTYISGSINNLKWKKQRSEEAGDDRFMIFPRVVIKSLKGEASYWEPLNWEPLFIRGVIFPLLGEDRRMSERFDLVDQSEKLYSSWAPAWIDHLRSFVKQTTYEDSLLIEERQFKGYIPEEGIVLSAGEEDNRRINKILFRDPKHQEINLRIP